MNKALLNKLLDYVETRLKLNNKQEQIEDDKGFYKTNNYIDNVIYETKELIYDIFEGKIPERIEMLLKCFSKVLESKKFYKDRHGKNCVFAVLFVAVWMLLEEVPGRPTV